MEPYKVHILLFITSAALESSSSLKKRSQSVGDIADKISGPKL